MTTVPKTLKLEGSKSRSPEPKKNLKETLNTLDKRRFQPKNPSKTSSPFRSIGAPIFPHPYTKSNEYKIGMSTNHVCSQRLSGEKPNPKRVSPEPVPIQLHHPHSSSSHSYPTPKPHLTSSSPGRSFGKPSPRMSLISSPISNNTGSVNPRIQEKAKGTPSKTTKNSQLFSTSKNNSKSREKSPCFFHPNTSGSLKAFRILPNGTIEMARQKFCLKCGVFLKKQGWLLSEGNLEEKQGNQVLLVDFHEAKKEERSSSELKGKLQRSCQRSLAIIEEETGSQKKFISEVFNNIQSKLKEAENEIISQIEGNSRSLKKEIRGIVESMHAFSGTPNDSEKDCTERALKNAMEIQKSLYLNCFSLSDSSVGSIAASLVEILLNSLSNEQIQLEIVDPEDFGSFSVQGNLHSPEGPSPIPKKDQASNQKAVYFSEKPKSQEESGLQNRNKSPQNSKEGDQRLSSIMKSSLNDFLLNEVDSTHTNLGGLTSSSSQISPPTVMPFPSSKMPGEVTFSRSLQVTEATKTEEDFQRETSKKVGERHRVAEGLKGLKEGSSVSLSESQRTTSLMGLSPSGLAIATRNTENMEPNMAQDSELSGESISYIQQNILFGKGFLPSPISTGVQTLGLQKKFFDAVFNSTES